MYNTAKVIMILSNKIIKKGKEQAEKTKEEGDEETENATA